MLNKILPKNNSFADFEVKHDFPTIGHKIMILNARQIYQKDIGRRMILLAIEDIIEMRKLEREKRNMFSMFAHDMKNPLVTSEGFLLRIISGKAGVVSEKQQKYHEIALSELGKVSRLISSFLEFSRFEAREEKTVFVPIDIQMKIQKNIEAQKVEAEKNRSTCPLKPQIL